MSALVDVALAQDCAVTVFPPENTHVGEVVTCVEQGKQFAVELVPIQDQGSGA